MLIAHPLISIFISVATGYTVSLAVSSNSQPKPKAAFHTIGGKRTEAEDDENSVETPGSPSSSSSVSAVSPSHTSLPENAAVDGRREFVWHMGNKFLLHHWIPDIKDEGAFTAKKLV
jgi:hypothetical protein